MAHYFFTLILSFLVGFAYAATVFPPAAPPYSSTFIEPQPPNITVEFRANYMQHKYDADVTHNNIISGFMYMSPTLKKIRLDGAYDIRLEASIFDFSNATADGLVSNVIFSFVGGLTNPTCSSYFVPPFIPLVPPNILSVTGAVYTGVQNDEIHGAVSTWVFAQNNTLVTMFLNPNNTLVRYDFVAPGALRTYATTRFFNIIFGPIDATVFETNCH